MFWKTLALSMFFGSILQKLGKTNVIHKFRARSHMV